MEKNPLLLIFKNAFIQATYKTICNNKQESKHSEVMHPTEPLILTLSPLLSIHI